MKKSKVKLSFRRLSASVLIVFARSIVSMMSANPLFAVPDVAYADILIAVSNFETALEVSLYGGKKDVSKMHEKKEILLNLLYKEADYVNRIADGVESIIENAGFETIKIPIPALRPEFKVIVGAEEGQVILIHKAVDKAGAYLWQYVTDPMPTDDKLWLLAGVSIQAKCVIENLDSGVKYWFRVTPITRKGNLPHSEPIMKLVS